MRSNIGLILIVTLTVSLIGATGGFCGQKNLAGTSWQLLSIQSMDDAQGTQKLKDSNRFTLKLGTDGQAVFGLDCNKGMGSYSYTQSSSDTTGTISFGPIGATRMACPPPHLDIQVVRDLGYVRSYILKNNKLYLSLMADGGIYEWAPLVEEASSKDVDQIVKNVEFDKGKSSSVISGSVSGRNYIDYQFNADAGQRLKLKFKGSSNANYFNLLPPGSIDAAMVIGEFSENKFDGILPDDGLYTIRVFLMRSAARRNESSKYSLTIDLSGTPLLPVSEKVDALVEGSRYHARGPVKCKQPYAESRECKASVVRRGNGSATVVLTSEKGTTRRILFIKGEPKAKDASTAMTFSKDESGWRINFGEDEFFEIPLELVYGG